jgi:hypothetical protein
VHPLRALLHVQRSRGLPQAIHGGGRVILNPPQMLLILALGGFALVAVGWIVEKLDGD